MERKELKDHLADCLYHLAEGAATGYLPEGTSIGKADFSPRDVLVKARAWLADEERWFQGANIKVDNALSEDDGYCEFGSAAVKACCASGALVHVVASQIASEGGTWSDRMRAYDVAEELWNDEDDQWHGGPGTALRDVVRFNDAEMTEHKDVLAVFDKAIEDCTQPCPIA